MKRRLYADLRLYTDFVGIVVLSVTVTVVAIIIVPIIVVAAFLKNLPSLTESASKKFVIYFTTDKGTRNLLKSLQRVRKRGRTFSFLAATGFPLMTASSAHLTVQNEDEIQNERVAKNIENSLIRRGVPEWIIKEYK